LGTDYLDLLQIHCWDPGTPLEETLRTLDQLVRDGRVCYLGASNLTGWQLERAMQLAAAHGWEPFSSLQPQYNLLTRSTEWELLPLCREHGLGVIPWGPLAGGWLTGKYAREERPSGATRLGENPERGMEAWKARNDNPRTWAVIAAVEDIAAAHDVSPSQVALAWLADRPAVTSVILGAQTKEQLADNLAASDLQLSPDETKQLTQASQPQVGVYPYGPMAQEQRSRKHSVLTPEKQELRDRVLEQIVAALMVDRDLGDVLGSVPDPERQDHQEHRCAGGQDQREQSGQDLPCFPRPG